jgi:hypothetical protein
MTFKAIAVCNSSSGDRLGASSASPGMKSDTLQTGESLVRLQLAMTMHINAALASFRFCSF